MFNFSSVWKKWPYSQPAFTCSELSQWRCSGVFIVNFEHISHLCSSASFVNNGHVMACWVTFFSLKWLITKKSVKLYLQPAPLPEILTIFYVQLTASKILTYSKPKFWFHSLSIFLIKINNRKTNKKFVNNKVNGIALVSLLLTLKIFCTFF